MEPQKFLVWIQDAVIFLVFFMLLRHTKELGHQWIQHE